MAIPFSFHYRLALKSENSLINVALLQSVMNRTLEPRDSNSVRSGSSTLELDETDRRILDLLQEDARRSFKDIAKEVDVSEATVFFRVKKLVKTGVIKSFKAIVDPKLVGKETLAFVMLRANPNVYTKVLPTLTEMDEVYEIYDVTGAYYAILKIRTRNTEELAALIDKIGMIEGITGTETAVVLRNIKEELTIKT